MSEFVGGEEKIINANDQIVFENKTDSNFEVGVGIIFHESGLYDISISENRVIVTKAASRREQPERKKRKWIRLSRCDMCPVCRYSTGRYERGQNFCPNCGADMRERSEDE